MFTTCLALSACSLPGENIDRIESNADRTIAKSGGAMASFSDTASLRGGGAQVSNGVFVAPLKERSNASALLPSRVQTVFSCLGARKV